MTSTPQTARHLCVVRLSGKSKATIEAINELNSEATALPIQVTCKQVPNELAAGDVALIWLGSDNNKGIATKWVQGFRAFGHIDRIDRTGGRNDPTMIDITLDVIFDRSLDKESILNAVGASYSRLVDFPVLGLSNYSSQVVQIVDSNNSKQDVQVFLRGVQFALGADGGLGNEQINSLLDVLGIEPRIVDNAVGPTRPDSRDVYTLEKFCDETGTPTEWS